MKHMWVELKYTPIDVDLVHKGEAGKEELRIYASEGAIEIADEEALYGCLHCHTPLAIDTLDDECAGAENNLPGTLTSSSE